MLLEQINEPNDIKKIEKSELPMLAEEIRDFLIKKIAITGGHLASNLGTVELTMALHLSLNLPQDKIIWDVGHQSYTHKLLTGRRDGFDNLRKYKGMSGFPKHRENECDAFDTGHSSTSISAGLGIIKAEELKGDLHRVVSVIGDGSLTGGMAYEALNNASRLNTNFIIVLNDNNMSISENVGGMSKYLNSIRTADGYISLRDNVYYSLLGKPHGEAVINKVRKTKNIFKQMVIPGMFFEDMGITYLGPVDGHDIDALVRVFKEAKRVNKAVLVHVITKKGKGYGPAEKRPDKFHGAEPFDVTTGIPLKKKEKPNYTDVFSKIMVKLGEADPDVVAITAAMPDGTGLKRFHNEYPDRFFDVGIAEGHAVTFAAGMAMGGMKPVVAIYSTFLQRAYDQLLHDVCIQNLPVTLAIDRAGLVGSDGETHHGVFDLSFLSELPGMVVAAPKNRWELGDMMRLAVEYNGPIAVRYPRGQAYEGLKDFASPVEIGKAEVIYRESGIALLAIGSMVPTGERVRELLGFLGIKASLVNMRFCKPLDENLLTELSEDHGIFVSLEENVLAGGMGSRIAQYVTDNRLGVKMLQIGIPDGFVQHGSREELLKELGMDAEAIVNRILEM